MTDELSFPRRYARTQRFTAGAPRSFAVTRSGARVVFVRSSGPEDPVGSLWTLDVGTGDERLVADPRDLLGGQSVEQLPAEERARRERARETAGGITTYALDRDGRLAAFALSGRLFLADLDTGVTRELAVPPPVFDPRPSPDGRRVAFVHQRGLEVVDASGPGDGDARVLVREDDASVAWGLAEFVAAEEMRRSRGFWWSPDSARLLVARVDESPVATWWIGDPANPAVAPRAVRYPAAGTANADVFLWLVDLSGARTPVPWDRDAYPYLVEVSWSAESPALLLVQSRDQRRAQVLTVGDTGATSVRSEDSDSTWLDIVPGVPRWLAGRLVQVRDDADTHRLVVGGAPVTPVGLQVREVVAAEGDAVVFTASEAATEQHVWRWSPTGLERLTSEAGVATAVAASGTVVVSSATLDRCGSRVTVAGHEVASYAATPTLALRLDLVSERVALLLPSGWAPEQGPLPVLLDPYGGPHAQRVLAARSAYLVSQWFAEQGFAVVVADGRGTPGSPFWEKAVAGDLATPALDDQIAALASVAAARPGALDPSRVAIRGWSFGGYLAALAVLRRPDVFSAAVAGAPVTDWRLYDTHYTERYLGVDAADAAYDRSSLLADAPTLARPLLLIHGLADDNVVAAHTLRLSCLLTAAGRPHAVLPLVGVTHMAPQEEVAENLLLLQVDFFRRALGLPRR